MTLPVDFSRPLAVLIVDDNRDAAESLAAALAVHGYVARVAYSGPDALAAVAADPPDVALLDIGMPGMSGWELAGRLRDQVPGRRPLLVAVTGYGTEADKKESEAAGIDLHLVKPVEPAVLVGVLRRFEQTLAGVPPAGGPDARSPRTRPGFIAVG